MLSAADTYSGGTTIDQGTLQLGDGGTSGSFVGGLTADNGVFAIDRSNTVTWTTAVSGTGAFEQLGTGATIFTAAESYTGGTTVLAGTLQLGSSGSLASGGSLTIDGGTFDLNGNNQTIGDLSGTGGAVTLGGGVLTLGSANSTGYSGTISGAGDFAKGGAGTLTLLGAVSASGVLIAAGGLQLGNGGISGSLSGDVLDEATLTIDRSGAVTLTGTVSGGGSLDQIGSGTVFITANDNYSGGTTISAGTLQLGDGSSEGSITGIILDNATFADDDSGSNTLSDAISGGGAFDQIGSGTTILTAVDSVSGGTTIAAGTLEIGSGGAIAGNATFIGQGVLRFDTGTNQLGGAVLNIAAGDDLDLHFQSFTAGDKAVWTQNGGTGTLDLETSGGAILQALTLAGTYSSNNFVAASDNSGGTVIETVAGLSPTIAGTVANQATTAEAPVNPFSGVAITDANAGATETLSITLSSTNGKFGTLSGAGLTGSGSTYQLAGTAAAITSELDALVFTPVNGVPGSSVTTTFDLSDQSSAFQTATTDNTTSVIDTDLTNPPQTSHTVNINEGASTGTLAAGDSDPDGDSITVTGVTGGTVGAPLAGSYGTLTLNADDTYSYTANDTSAINAAPPGNPTDSFAYTVSDGHGGSATETLNFVIERSHVVDDFNADLTSDALWRSIDGSLAEWLMNGSVITSSAGPTYQGSVVSPDLSWNVVGTGDFNDDGKADILWRQSTTGALADWTMNGATITSSANVTSGGSAVSPDSTWSVAGIGDFNGDGDADILWRQSTTGTLADWTMNGSTITSSASPTYQGSAVMPDSSWSVAGTGDFNGDGKTDILWQQGSTGLLEDCTMNGSTITSSASPTYQGSAVMPDSSWSVVGIGDFNGDGKADILWRQSGTGSLAIWLMNGSTIQSSAAVTYQGSAVTPDSSWNIFEVGAFSSSKDAGIIWQQSTTGDLVEWQMNGSQIVSSQTITSNGSPVAPNPSVWT